MFDDARSSPESRWPGEEPGWAASDAYGLLGRIFLVIGVVLMLGVSAAALVENYSEPAPATSSSKGAPRTVATPASSR